MGHERLQDDNKFELCMHKYLTSRHGENFIFSKKHSRDKVLTNIKQ